ncbi:hypothetical protein [Vreelandella profundi]|uniref:hypothetical protein n=1 Tax=Vreelandella profundi TaxID=2852117 RepID=UPI001F43B861|nr:hypothetical protein [Halomonas profundi]
MKYKKICVLIIGAAISNVVWGDSGEFETFAKCDGVMNAAYRAGVHSENLTQSTLQYASRELMTAAFSEDQSKGMDDYQNMKNEGVSWFHETHDNENTSLFLVSLCATVAQDADIMNNARE